MSSSHVPFSDLYDAGLYPSVKWRTQHKHHQRNCDSTSERGFDERYLISVDDIKLELSYFQTGKIWCSTHRLFKLHSRIRLKANGCLEVLFMSKVFRVKIPFFQKECFHEWENIWITWCQVCLMGYKDTYPSSLQLCDFNMI